MKTSSLNYYGYDKETHHECMGLIRTTNYKHMHILNIWFIAVNVFFVICSYFNLLGLNRLKIANYAFFLGLAIIFEVVIIAFRSRMEKTPFPLVYLSILILMVYSINVSMGQAYLAATMYLVFVVLIALAYIDTMIKITIMLLAYSVVFVFTSYANKPESIAAQDLYNVIIFLTLALALHYTFQRARMQQFVTYQNNVRIQQELEVRSSFDALTSLLNRGRFFSLAGDVLKGQHDGEYMAIALIDLDSFKQINDKLGHQMGDKAIQITGTTITETLGADLSEKWSFTQRAITDKMSFAGRLGGDEFIVLMRGLNGREEVVGLLQQMLGALNAVRFDELNGIYASFGVTEVASEDHDIDDCYNRADAALYESKRSGKNQMTFSSEAGQG